MLGLGLETALGIVIGLGLGLLIVLGLGMGTGLKNGLILGLGLVSGMARDRVKIMIKVRDSFRVSNSVKVRVTKG